MGGLKKQEIKTDESGTYYIDKNGKRVATGTSADADLPPIAPTPTDEALRRKRSLALTRAGLGYGRKSTMLTGTMTEPTLQKTTVGGY